MALSLFASVARSDNTSDVRSSSTNAVSAEIADNGLSAASAFSNPDGSFGAFAVSRNAGTAATVTAIATFSSDYKISNRRGEVAQALALNFNLTGSVAVQSGSRPLDFAAASISFSGTVTGGGSVIKQDGAANIVSSTGSESRFTGIFANTPGVQTSASGSLFNLPIGFRTAKASQGKITLTLTVGATTLKSLGAPNFSSADFGRTVKLDSITVADPLSPSDLAGMKVTLESGYEVRVMPQVAGSRTSGTEGNDQLTGAALDDALDGKGGNDTISGLSQNDMIVGGTGNDTLSGGQGDDVIYGDEGDDTIVGNEGVDYLFGDSGRDRFVFDINRPFNRGTMGIDQVVDFQKGADQIALARSTFTGVKKLSFGTVRNLAKAQRSSAQIVYIQQTGSLFYNQNGKKAGFGKGGQFADLSDGLALARQDLVIV
jgi:Ca2+-binding RTX toxin-like protein